MIGSNRWLKFSTMKGKSWYKGGMDSPGKMMKFRFSALVVIFFITIGCPDKEVPQEAGFEAVNVSNTPYRSEDPTMAVGPDGTVYVFWEEWNPDSGGVYYTYRSPDGKWSDVAFVCKGGSPYAKVDNSGTIHLAYKHDFVIHYIKKPPGGDWTQPEYITALGMSCDPKFEIDRWGNIHLIFSELIGAIRIFYSKRSANGGWWSQPVELNKEAAFHRLHTRITVNAQGDAFVTWTNVVTDTGPDYILYTTNAIGDTWSYPVPLNSGILPIAAVFRTDIAVDSWGTIHVIWCDDTHGLLYRYNKFGMWSAPVVVDSSAGVNSLLEIDQQNRLHVVYDGHPESGIYYRIKKLYGNWSDRICCLSPRGIPKGMGIYGGDVYTVFADIVDGEWDIFFVEGRGLY